MATRIEVRPSLYEQDVYAWSKTQADLLRAGRFTELDLEHVDRATPCQAWIRSAATAARSEVRG